MKNTHTIITRSAAIALALAALLPIAAHAQDNTAPAGQMPRPAAAVRQQILERNRDIRNDAMKRGSSTRPIMLAERVERMGEIRRSPMWLGTSSPALRNISSSTLMQIRQNAGKLGSSTMEARGKAKARLDVFAAIQNRLVGELDHSLSNLKNLRERIADRIASSTQSGRDMTEASQLLTAADLKLTAAGTAIQNLANLVPPIASSTAKVSTSTEVSLEKPREIGSTAIKALKDARDALNDVAIAHSMGRKNGQAATTNATSTQQ